MMQKIFLFLMLALMVFVSTGCLSVTYQNADLPRTPLSIRHVVKNGSFKLIIDEPILSERITEKPSALIGGGGVAKITFSPGEFITPVASEILKEVVADTVGNQTYIYRVKDFKFYWKTEGGTLRNPIFVTKAFMRVEISAADGKVLLSNTYSTDFEKTFEGGYDHNAVSACWSQAIAYEVRQLVCQSIEEFSKNE